MLSPRRDFCKQKRRPAIREHAWKVNSADKKWKAKESELAEYQSDLKESAAALQA